MSTPAEESTTQKKMEDLMHAGYSMLGLALGYDLGLIQALGELNRPVTARELAEKTDCKERYVREWLLQMTMAKFLEMDDSCNLFSLPEGSLEGLKTLAWSAGCLRTLAGSHEPLVNAFRSSGPRGFPYSDGRPFLKFVFDENTSLKQMWGEDCPALMKNLGGLQAKLETGCDVLDIGCYAGDFSLTVAPLFPRSTFYGVDVSEETIATARKKAESQAVRNVRFEVEDAADLPAEWSSKFDAILLFNTIHDLPLPSQTCAEIARLLKQDGYCIVRDMNIPSNPTEQRKTPTASTELYTISLYHCLPMSLNTPGSEGLGTCLGAERIIEMLEKTGLKHVPLAGMTLPSTMTHSLVFGKLQ